MVMTPAQTDAIAVLSIIFNQQITSDQVDADTVFLAATASLLLGVMHADEQVVDAEKTAIQTILKQVIPDHSPLRQTASRLLKGVQAHKIYRSQTNMVALASALEDLPQVVLIGIGYCMTVVDGHLDEKESSYIRAIATQISINRDDLAVLDTIFQQRELPDASTANELKTRLLSLIRDEATLISKATQLLLNQWANLLPQAKRSTPSPELQASQEKLHELLQKSLTTLEETMRILRSKPRFGTVDSQEIWTEIAFASGRRVKIASQERVLKERVLEDITTKWPTWLEETKTRLAPQWSDGPRLDALKDDERVTLAKDYATQLAQAFEAELETWVTQILQKHLAIIDQALQATHQGLSSFNNQVHDLSIAALISDIQSLQQQSMKPFSDIQETLFTTDTGFSPLELAGFVTGSALNLIGSFASGIFGGSKGNVQDSSPTLKKVIFEKGCERTFKHSTALQKTTLTVAENLVNQQVTAVVDILDRAIARYNCCLEIRERDQAASPEQNHAEQEWVTHQYQTLLTIKNACYTQ